MSVLLKTWTGERGAITLSATPDGVHTLTMSRGQNKVRTIRRVILRHPCGQNPPLCIMLWVGTVTVITCVSRVAHASQAPGATTEMSFNAGWTDVVRVSCAGNLERTPLLHTHHTHTHTHCTTPPCQSRCQCLGVSVADSPHLTLPHDPYRNRSIHRSMSH